MSFEINKMFFNLNEIIVYKMNYQESFFDDQKLLFDDNLERIFLFSDIVCKNFIKILKKDGGINLVKTKSIFCISDGGINLLKKDGIFGNKFNYR